MRIVVLGSGIAGLNFALKAASLGQVVLITKKELMESNTNYAQGGIAAVLDTADKYHDHLKDTLLAGAGLCDEKAVKVLVKKAPAEIRELLRLGVGFNRELDGKLSLTREGGHHARRIAFAKDATGNEIEQTLARHIRAHKNIEIWEDHMAYEFVKDGENIVAVKVFDPNTQELEIIEGNVFVLATGGFGQLYAKTSNPKIATGDGMVMAYKVGAKLADLEFMQFHPTSFDKDNYPHFLISETLRGEGGVLEGADGKRFMQKYHEMQELAPRDIVARAILAESQNGQVYLNMTHLDKSFLKARFPMIYERLWWYGIKMEKDRIPISPAAHYACGGVLTDTWGRTNIPNLYAFGEVACTGVHGANRLASNSLMESLVFGTRAFEDLKKRKEIFVKTHDYASLYVGGAGTKDVELSKKSFGKIEEVLRKLMWEKVGIVREAGSLKEALQEIGKLQQKFKKLVENGISKSSIRAENLLCLAELLTKAALQREESRGAHYRSDFPEQDRKWKKRIIIDNEK